MINKNKKTAVCLITLMLVMGIKTPILAANSRLDWVQTQKGDRAEYVRSLQYLLRARGFKVKPNGIFTVQTVNAVKIFQRRRKLIVNGIVGGRTWEALVITVRRGQKGDAVRAVQNILNYSGYKVSIDGNFGTQTQAAVAGFQSDIMLKSDGVVDLPTWNTLFNQGMFAPDS